MIAAAAEPVAPRHQADAVVRHVDRADPRGELRERSRRRVLGPFRVDPDRRAVDAAVAAARSADDVVVEPGLDRQLVVLRLLRVRARADQPLLFPATVMKTSVASNSMPLSAKTRASSIDSTVPLPSSLAPGATMFGSRAGRAAGRAPAARRAPAAPRRAASGRPGRRGHLEHPARLEHPQHRAQRRSCSSAGRPTRG